MGDIDTLAASIERNGLLQPITVTPEGVLVCGARRLAALRSLGVRKINVWVRAGVTDRLAQVLAEQDDDALHKALTPTEAASLYRELKALLAEDAARRQELSRFTRADENPRSDGAATVAAPSTAKGDTRAQAAQLVTGRSSYTTLERIGGLQTLAADPAIDPALRLTSTGRARPDRRRWHPSLRAHHRLNAELEELASRALERAKPAMKRSARAGASQPRRTVGEDAKLPVRAFVFLWDDLRGWWEQYDCDEIAASLTDAQWHQFEETIAGTVAFSEAVRTARMTVDHSRSLPAG